MYPSSPKPQNSCSHHSPHQAAAQDFGPLPISPHVNVPNAHNFIHAVPPPPLPPRVRRKNSHTAISQIRQAPDAPKLPARDQSPPPLPPRTHLSNSSNMNDSWNHSPFPQFNLSPHTSTIMMRRNSALEKQERRDSPQTPSFPSCSSANDQKISHISPISIPPRKIRYK